MANKLCFESLDKSSKNIMSNDNVVCQKFFGGKIIVFGGDFRQILPVVHRGTKSDIIHSTINALYIWDHCKVLKLAKNMRLESGSNSINVNEIQKFSKLSLEVGDGKISEPNDGYAEITVPPELLLTNFVDSILPSYKIEVF